MTIFLARFFGLYCAAIALAMFIRKRETIATINAMIDDPGALLIAGVIAFAGGTAMVLGHQIWQGGWLAIAITCLGWVVAAKGAMLLFLPRKAMKSFYGSLHYEKLFNFYMGLTLLLGLVLLAGSFG